MKDVKALTATGSPSTGAAAVVAGAGVSVADPSAATAAASDARAAASTSEVGTTGPGAAVTRSEAGATGEASERTTAGVWLVLGASVVDSAAAGATSSVAAAVSVTGAVCGKALISMSATWRNETTTHLLCRLSLSLLNLWRLNSKRKISLVPREC